MWWEVGAQSGARVKCAQSPAPGPGQGPWRPAGAGSVPCVRAEMRAFFFTYIEKESTVDKI